MLKKLVEKAKFTIFPFGQFIYSAINGCGIGFSGIISHYIEPNTTSSALLHTNTTQFKLRFLLSFSFAKEI